MNIVPPKKPPVLEIRDPCGHVDHGDSELGAHLTQDLVTGKEVEAGALNRIGLQNEQGGNAPLAVEFREWSLDLLLGDQGLPPSAASRLLRGR